jgi:hypothetical protein
MKSVATEAEIERKARETGLERTHPQDIMERLCYNRGWKDCSEYFSKEESWDVFLCPGCGLLDSDCATLIEGHDGTIFGQHPGGDGYTGEMFCDSSKHRGEVLPVKEIQVRRVPC